MPSTSPSVSPGVSAPTAAPAAAGRIVELTNVTKTFGRVTAVDDFYLEVHSGEFLTLLGPSGCGKTTVLRLMMGLLKPDSGSVRVAGRDIRHCAPHELGLGVVFQSLALFPHMTVADNVAFPLRMRRISKPERRQRALEALDLVRLEGVADSRIHQLSGGQRQRVALARALVFNPVLLLLDEPLSALDRRLRESLQLELARLHRDLQVTIIDVTHDQREAFLISDRVVLMGGGRIAQVGSGLELYASPATRFVAGFLGDPLLIDGTVRDGVMEADHLRLAVPAETPPGPATLVLRPEALHLTNVGERLPSPTGNVVDGQIVFSSFDGTGVFSQVALPGTPYSVAVHMPLTHEVDVSPGSDVSVSWIVEEAPVITHRTL